jgi:hypothetical protein
VKDPSSKAQTPERVHLSLDPAMISAAVLQIKLAGCVDDKM